MLKSLFDPIIFSHGKPQAKNVNKNATGITKFRLSATGITIRLVLR